MPPGRLLKRSGDRRSGGDVADGIGDLADGRRDEIGVVAFAAAVSAMRRVVQEGHTPRPLQE